MAEANEPRAEPPKSKADAMALVEEAEAEAAEAEALAAAAHARTRAARMRREALALTEGAKGADSDAEGEEAEDAEDAEDAEEAASAETVEYVIPEGLAGLDDSEDAADLEEPEEAEEEARPGRRRWLSVPSRSAIGKAAAILLICSFAALSGLMMFHHHKSTERQQRASAFIAGAKRGVVNMISLDFSKAKEDVQRVIDSSTGKFRDDFAQQSADFTKTVEQSKVVTEGTVTAAALESMNDSSALVLVSATSRITNLPTPQQPRAWRLKVTVTEDGGQYKMSKVEFVP